MVTLIRVEPTQAEGAATIAGRALAPVSATPVQDPRAAVNALPSSEPCLAPVVTIERKVRRSICPSSGMALEKLAHAIEYLTDEYAFEAAVSGSFMAGDPTLQAIQLLMSLNRQVYFECPIVAPLTQRIFSRLFPEQSQPTTR